MKFAIIENGIVKNIALSNDPINENWIQSDDAKIGDLYADGKFTTPETKDDPMAYKTQRAAEYPPAADYLDGIVKNDQDQVQAYINACLAVKAKYPKPEN